MHLSFDFYARLSYIRLASSVHLQVFNLTQLPTVHSVISFSENIPQTMLDFAVLVG